MILTRNMGHHHLKDLDSPEVLSEVLARLHKAREMAVATHLAPSMEHLIVAGQVHLDLQAVDRYLEVMEIETGTHCNLHMVHQAKALVKAMDCLEME